MTSTSTLSASEYLVEKLPKFSLLVLFFFVMSGMDFLVHGVLYKYGLRFNFEWAYFYWVLYAIAFILFLLVMESKLGFMLWLGGLQDVLFFLFWTRAIPTNIWWWHPFAWLGLPWNFSLQIGFLALVLVVGCFLMWFPSKGWGLSFVWFMALGMYWLFRPMTETVLTVVIVKVVGCGLLFWCAWGIFMIVASGIYKR